MALLAALFLVTIAVAGPQEALAVNPIGSAAETPEMMTFAGLIR